MNIKKIRTLIIALMVILYIVSVVSADSSDHHKEAKFYADKSQYNTHQHVKLTLKNEEKKKSIFLQCDGKIKIENTKTGHTVAEVDWNLKGKGCADGPTYNFNVNGGNTYELKPKNKITLEWDQPDSLRGKYKAYTKYNDNDGRNIWVHTDTFELKN